MKATEELLRLAKRCMTPTYDAPSLVAHRGQGTRLWDLEGKEYLDFAGGMGVNILGHAHPALVQAISDQAGRLCHTSNSFHHAPHIELCAKLCKLSFGDSVYLCNSGAEAVEAAMKMARRHFFDVGSPRQEFVAADNSFHGRTLGALSVTGQSTYRKGFEPLVPSVNFVPFNDLAALEKAVSPRTAAVVLEPIQGNGGVLVAKTGYLQGAQAICRQHGALLIFDEVQTGVGRTGKWFAYQHDSVEPDILCLAKALGGGLPLGAIVTRTNLGEHFKPGVHGTTFGGNPVACAAGIATLQVLEKEHLVDRGNTLGAQYREMLGALRKKHVHLLEIRGRGMLVGLCFDIPVREVQASCRAQGLLGTAAGPHVYRLFPPLNVSEDDLHRSVGLIDQALSKM